VTSRDAKDRVVGLAGRCVRSPFLAWSLRPFFRRRVNVFFCHGVWPAGAAPLRLFTGMALDRFVSDVRAMHRFFEFVELERLLDGSPGDPRARPLAALTFDDGFDLTGSGATDVLDELGIRATTFVNSASVSYEALMWQHQFYAIRAERGDDVFVREMNRVLEKTGLPPMTSAGEQARATRGWPASRKDEYAQAVWRACGMPAPSEVLQEHRPYFDWDGLRDWVRRGHDVGFHTRTHPFCSGLREDEVEPELIAPVGELRGRLGLARVPFAYPFGDRLPPGREAALAGRRVFSCLLGTDGLSLRPADPHRIERLEVEPGVDRQIFGWAVVRPLKRALLGRPGPGAPGAYDR
jgi:peptidoglycan/xylan/chitin deacetylase (PgdA/CDA1 family)